MKLKDDKKHHHDLVAVEKPIPLYRYVIAPNGGYTQGGTVAYDTIKGFKCKCGYAVASDLERMHA